MSRKKLVKINDEQLMLESSQVADIYHQLTLDLFDQVIDRIKERGPVSLEKNPYIWQLQKMNEMHLLNEDNVKLIAERSGIAEEQLKHIIENEGLKVYQDTRTQLAEDMGAGLPNPTITQEVLAAYSRQAMQEVDNLINTILPRSVLGTYQDIIEQSVAQVVMGLKTADKAISESAIKAFERGFHGFTDKGGKRWKADNYARMVIRSTVNRVRNEVREAPARELGIDTFYYSKKLAARAMCAPLQHQIVTLGPAREEAGHDILSLHDYGYGTPGGCRGVNCGHIMTPFIPGVNNLPELGPDVKNITPEQAIENANVQAKQRALERSIRQSKEYLHVAEKLGDQELIDKYKSKVRTQQGAIRDYLKRHPFLHRDYAREKYYDDPFTQAKKEVKLRRELSKLEKFREQQKEMLEKFQYAVENGIIKTEVNTENYENHVRGTKGYQNYVDNNIKNGKPNPSYLTISKEEVQELVDKHAGTGQFRYSPEAKRFQEIISQEKVIGTYIDQKTGEIIENVRDFRIHYSQTGSHIVPTIKGKGSQK